MEQDILRENVGIQDPGQEAFRGFARDKQRLGGADIDLSCRLDRSIGSDSRTHSGTVSGRPITSSSATKRSTRPGR